MWFSYDPEGGFETHDTEEEARNAADGYLDSYRDEAPDGWYEGVEQVCWGRIHQAAAMTNKRDPDPEHSNERNFAFVCDYELTDVDSE